MTQPLSTYSCCVLSSCLNVCCEVKVFLSFETMQHFGFLDILVGEYHTIILSSFVFLFLFTKHYLCSAGNNLHWNFCVTVEEWKWSQQVYVKEIDTVCSKKPNQQFSKRWINHQSGRLVLPAHYVPHYVPFRNYTGPPISKSHIETIFLSTNNRIKENMHM